MNCGEVVGKIRFGKELLGMIELDVGINISIVINAVNTKSKKPEEIILKTLKIRNFLEVLSIHFFPADFNFPLDIVS